ncbi:hypothetical protein VTN02DRAFT_3810 [Thermoascus thermophilus]
MIRRGGHGFNIDSQELQHDSLESEHLTNEFEGPWKPWWRGLGATNCVKRAPTPTLGWRLGRWKITVRKCLWRSFALGLARDVQISTNYGQLGTPDRRRGKQITLPAEGVSGSPWPSFPQTQGPGELLTLKSISISLSLSFLSTVAPLRARILPTTTNGL